MNPTKNLPPCPECKGAKTIRTKISSGAVVVVPCPKCGGSGRKGPITK